MKGEQIKMKCINAEELKYWIKSRTKEGQKKVSIATVMNIIECQPSVPMESVVYCKNCAIADEDGYCMRFKFYPYTDDYCSYGIPRKPIIPLANDEFKEALRKGIR